MDKKDFKVVSNYILVLANILNKIITNSITTERTSNGLVSRYYIKIKQNIWTVDCMKPLL